MKKRKPWFYILCFMILLFCAIWMFLTNWIFNVIKERTDKVEEEQYIDVLRYVLPQLTYYDQEINLDELTEEQIKAYRLVDNKLNESEWDTELLKQSLDEIVEMDMEAFGFELEVMEDEMMEVEPEVPFTEVLNEENNYIVLKFNNKIDWLNALGVFGIEKVQAYPTKKNGNKKSFGTRAGVGRVLDGQQALERVQGNEI